MSEQDYEEPVASEQEQDVSEVDQEYDEPKAERKMVPLTALQMERRKRQELEMQLQQKQQMQPEEEYDPEALVENKDLRSSLGMTKREIREEIYRDMNPQAIQKINKYLKPILEKKPWLAESVDTAENRYARAAEIVEDYLHLVQPSKTAPQTAGERMVANAEKPRSPAEIGKSAQLSGAEYLKSIQGTSEFREYRNKIRGRR